MKTPKLLLTSLAVLICAVSHAQSTKLAPSAAETPHLLELPIETWPESGALELQGPLPSIIKVWLASDTKKTPLEFGFNKDASLITVYLPAAKPANHQDTLRFLVTEVTTIHSDGTIVLSALDSQVIGEKAKLETHPGSHRIGFWGRAEDFVRWDAEIPAGDYDVDLVYSRASATGTEVAISIGETVFPLKLETTGSWYRYRVARLGELTVSETKTQRIETRVKKIINGGVMNLKALVLTPRSSHQLRIPAVTAYLDPVDGNAKFSREQGFITGWNDPETKINWFGEFREPGSINVSIAVDLPESTALKFRLTFAGETREAEGVPGANHLSFGEFKIEEPGYQTFTLESLNPKGPLTLNSTRCSFRGPQLKLPILTSSLGGIQRRFIWPIRFLKGPRFPLFMSK